MLNIFLLFINSVYQLRDFMLQIRDLHIARDEKDIGFYAGFVGEFSTNSSCSLPKQREQSRVITHNIVNDLCQCFTYRDKHTEFLLLVKVLHLWLVEHSPL
jgi:hypothetical protein